MINEIFIIAEISGNTLILARSKTSVGEDYFLQMENGVIELSDDRLSWIIKVLKGFSGVRLQCVNACCDLRTTYATQITTRDDELFIYQGDALVKFNLVDIDKFTNIIAVLLP